MQTNFTLAQLANPDIAATEKILRACVHCGFCTATCPTYVLLGDELDSPRGRIYLIKDMLEDGTPPSSEVVKHVDRCLSCLSCITTCPSGVNYMHLVDHGRKHIEAHYRRPLLDRALRSLLAWVLPRPALFRLALYGARLGRPLGRVMRGRLRAMLALAPATIPASSPVDRPQVFPAEGKRRARVALLNGCAQRVLDPDINEATIRLLTRHGVEVVVARGAGCCGALTHHLGREAPALRSAKANIAAWLREAEDGGLDAVIVNTSGCGTTLKDYGFMLRDDLAWADKAARVSALAKDVSEFMSDLGLMPPAREIELSVAYHAACSLQHGQKVTRQPKTLLAAAGFTVLDVPEGHLCCGSAGTYNLLQPALAQTLRDRKASNITGTKAHIVAAGNLGCMIQIGGTVDMPMVHTVELLDWATGGPLPKALVGFKA